MKPTEAAPSEPPAAPDAPVEAAPGAEPTPPPQPDAVSRAEFEAGLRALGESIVEGLRQPPPPPPALPRDITDAELDAAAAEGRPIAPLIEQRLRAREAALRAEYDQRLANLEAEGRGAIGTIANTVMPGSLPYFEPYKKEIRQQLADWDKINPGASSNPTVIKNAHDLVAGRHATEIAARERREALREQRETAATAAPGASGREVGKEAARPLRDIVPPEARRTVDNEGEMANQLRISNRGRRSNGLKERTMEEFQNVLRDHYSDTVH